MQTTVQIEIDAPSAAVFDFVADLANNPSWQSGVASAEWVTSEQVTVGAVCRQTMDDGSVVDYRITDVVPGRSITMEPESGSSLATSVTRTVQVLSDTRCRVRMDLVGQVGGWRVLLRPLVIRSIRSSIESDYRRLKRLLETDEASADG